MQNIDYYYLWGFLCVCVCVGINLPYLEKFKILILKSTFSSAQSTKDMVIAIPKTNWCSFL